MSGLSWYRAIFPVMNFVAQTIEVLRVVCKVAQLFLLDKGGKFPLMGVLNPR
jgi:hypothetical protein